MREIACDVAVIGAGTAGIAAHRAARKAGAEAVLIEAGPGGTTCARVGCMPSKLLTAAAAAAHDAGDAGRFGIRTGAVTVDGRAVLARVRAERDRFVSGVLATLDALPADSRLAGRARFADPGTLIVDDHTRIRFGAAVIATGSSPSVPEPLRGCGDRVLTTDTLFDIDDLPASLAVLGGGPVGIELAQAMARLGVETAVFDPGESLARLRDPDLAALAREVFGAGMALHLGSTVEAAERAGEGVRLHWTTPGGGGTKTFARVLAAAGRSPNVRGLGLDAAGLERDDHGVPRFDARTLRCGATSIFVCGDANAARPVLHEAARQGGIAGRNAAALAAGGANPLAAPAPWVALALVFTHPQVAAVGELPDPDATDRLVGSASFGDQGRARIMGRGAGALRLYADRSGRLTGAEMIGPEVEHLAHLLALAIADGHDARSLRDRPFYHPTVEESLKTALSEIVDGQVFPPGP